MDPAQHRAAVLAEGTRVADLPASALASDVRACPGWDLERLITHLGRVHGWAADFLAGMPADEAGRGGTPRPEGPAVLEWYRGRLDTLLAELDRHDPAEAVESFAGPTTAAFWFRRQAHETIVHRWDAQQAATPDSLDPFAPDLAADGVDEWLDVFVPRFLARSGVPEDLVGATLHLHCTDEAGIEGTGEWLLRLTEEGSELTRAHAKGDAALRAPAADLLLTVWHRTDLSAIDVVGDADRAQAVLDAIHVT